MEIKLISIVSPYYKHTRAMYVDWVNIDIENRYITYKKCNESTTYRCNIEDVKKILVNGKAVFTNGED